MNEQVQLIRAEIERRRDDNLDAGERFAPNSYSRLLFASAAKEDFDLLTFIDYFINKPKDKIQQYLDASPAERRKMNMSEILDETRGSCPEESDDLEAEIKSWIPARVTTYRKEYTDVLIEWGAHIARHFAEWGAKHIKEMTYETIN